MAEYVNLVKLCVGADGPDQLQSFQSARFGKRQPEHVTRMWPKREAELLAGGSIYWVFKGMLLARQRIAALERRVGGDGISRCVLRLDPEIVRTAAVPRRPFQGWRYLDHADAPIDLPKGRAHDDALPAELAAELADMGLR